MQTWARTPARTVPHLVAAFHLEGTHPTPTDRSSRALLEVSADVRGGGLGHTWGGGHADGEPVPGYRVAVGAFGRGGWVPLGEVAGATPEQPEDWSASFDSEWTCGERWCDDATIDGWQTEDGRLLLDVAPLAPQGASPVPGTVALDYVALRVRYWRTGCLLPDASGRGGTPDGVPCDDGRPETAGETCQETRCIAP